MNLLTNAYSKEEIQLLWDNIDNVNSSTIAQSVLIMIHTGLRVKELLSLKTADVHLDERYIDIKEGKVERKVSVHEAIVPLLEKKLAEGHEYLITHDGEKINYNDFKCLHSVFCNELKINHSVHAGRHTFLAFSKF